jgi:hypothetical protein
VASSTKNFGAKEERKESNQGFLKISRLPSKGYDIKAVDFRNNGDFSIMALKSEELGKGVSKADELAGWLGMDLEIAKPNELAIQNSINLLGAEGALSQKNKPAQQQSTKEQT